MSLDLTKFTYDASVDWQDANVRRRLDVIYKNAERIDATLKAFEKRFDAIEAQRDQLRAEIQEVLGEAYCLFDDLPDGVKYAGYSYPSPSEFTSVDWIPSDFRCY